MTTPCIPGLELRLPPNTVIRDHDGKVVRELSITPIPIDRTPFPLPENVEVPIHFTVQPGGAYIYSASKYRGARFIYPNYRKVATGVLANFWHYDPDRLGWYVNGAGVVRPGHPQRDRPDERESRTRTWPRVVRQPDLASRAKDV